MEDKKRQIAELRERIAAVDVQIREQLEARARLSREIYALLEGEAPLPELTERDWLKGIEAQASGDLACEELSAIFSRIRASARALEQPARVAYVGPEGGFCHELSRGYFGASATFIECATTAEALEHVVRGRAVHAVFPFESSVDGLALGSIRALESTDLVLVADRNSIASYDLMSQTTNLADIDKVYATAVAHAGCELFLDRELPSVTVIDVRTPLVAAQLATDDRGSAAIVSERAGRAAGLELVRRNIGDAAEVRVRYAIAGARPAMRTGHDTTCLLFSVDDAPGALFGVLRHFAERGINLKKLQSRPVHETGWDYVFYVEVTGHVTDRPVVTALEAVKRVTKYLRVLGSFPSGE
jgi:chorismate mutase / prephenate dehydratase